MDKPEDIAQWAWDEASKCVPNYVKRTIVEGIARAILSDQSQAYIDAARVADQYADAIAIAGEDGNFMSIAPTISAAILQRKEEIGRN